MKALTAEAIKEVVVKKGYKWFEDRVNIVGVRTNDNTPDKFNDFITITWMGKIDVFEATTDPGVYYLKNPMRSTGTFVLPPGQYVDCWTWGMHTTYEALVLCKQINGWRDNDRDDIVDPDKTVIFKDGQGVDIHHAHTKVWQWVIGKYSAGCQVIRKFEDWLKFYAICKASKQRFFTYTLLTEDDL